MTLVTNKHVQFGDPPRLLTHPVGSFEDDFSGERWDMSSFPGGYALRGIISLQIPRYLTHADIYTF